MRIRNIALAVVVSLCALAGALGFASTSAWAAVTHKYLSSPITEVPAKGPPPAEEAIPFPGALKGISNMAEDSGDLYLVRGDDFLDEFNASTGAFIAQFPRPAEPLFDFHQGLAVGHGAGETEVYVGGDESGTETQGRLAVYDAVGHLQATWNGADTPAGHFGCFECGGEGGVAADNSANLLTKGRVYVVDPLNHVVDVFEPQAGGGEQYLTQITGPEPQVPFANLGGARAASVAVNQSNGDVLVMEGTTMVDVFEPTALGEYALVRRLTSTPAGAFERISGVTSDGASGDIYVWEAERQVVDQFSAAGTYLGRLTGTANTPAGAFGFPSAVAVDPTSGDVYVGDRQINPSGVEVTSVHIFGPSVVIPDVTTAPASSVKAASATLNGTVNPDEAGSASCRFEWGTSASFGNVAPCEPESVANGANAVAVHAELGDLQTDTTYYYRLQASSANGTNPGETRQDQTFTTPGPGIDEEYASAVTATSVTLGAKIDPNNVATSYYFQYGTGATYGTTVPAAPGVNLGAGKGDLPVSVHLQGLAGGTVYRYRVVAVSEPEGQPLMVDGVDKTFTTQAEGAEVKLPDGRQWEMVSPPNKQGAAIKPLGDEGGGDIQASAEGNGITYTASAPFVANPAGSRSPEVTQVISTRSAPGSWSTADITTPHDNGASAFRDDDTAEYRLFSPDLSLGLIEPADNSPLPPLSSGAEKTIYLRGANDEYTALVTSANVLAGTTFGNKLGFDSASPDLSHVVLESEAQLTDTPRPSTGGYMLYEWTGGQLQAVSILPDGEPASAVLGDFNGVVRHAISDDGSRVVWQPFLGEDHHLYLRDLARGETIAVDTAQGAPEPKDAGSKFRTANASDSRVFFTSGARLTADSTAIGGEDLYVFEVTSGSGSPSAGRLTDLSVDPNVGEGASVQGVIGASEDGSYVYFVAEDVLGNASQHGATRGGNLYVEHYDAETEQWTTPTFIAALSNADNASWGEGPANHDLGAMTSRVSPDGRYLTFMSSRSLTGYENRDANSDVSDEEIFLYDAATNRLVCASCNPTGGRPVGVFTGDENETIARLTIGTRYAWVESWLAANIPIWEPEEVDKALYQSRYLSNDGRLFFDSSDALVPADVNGNEDVYEYEPAGVGSCQGPTHGQRASVVYSASAEGCVGLISSGTSSEESALLDASETGGDVFFLTLSRLSPQDYDTSLDIYDAHECTATAPCALPTALTPPPCSTGDACKTAPVPQPTLFGAPSSETFAGAGNVVSSTVAAVKPRSSSTVQKLTRALKLCKQQPKRKRASCERRARKRYGAPRTAAKKSSSAAAGR